jgi:hypothetical protein
LEGVKSADSSIPHNALFVENKRVFLSPVHINWLRAIPRNLDWLQLVIPVRKTELVVIVVSESPKASRGEK